ncbi:hypothetical protein Lal_00018838 [Lupinus albus]|uniref:Putative transferase n=1 Tax=Lupinus albus TaxID=3870 RepID=A0A6A4P7K0_LUPAL|nr:putative transferase [Lupinus albus]KAF1862994.1 hypothetical protein Lal_00018838 [Lupinus albus]
MSKIVKVIEQYKVTPPTSSSIPITCIPLTFFDIPWLCCPPIQRIFFFNFPHSLHYFMQTFLPILKLSLSLTLQHFFPFASNLVLPSIPNLPYILYSHGDFVSFTVAQSTHDFINLVNGSIRDVTELHPFVPSLPSPRILEDGTQMIPCMAIQVTVFPNSGFTICLTFRHVVADGKSFHHFMKFWASVCRSKGNLASLEGSLAMPLHNRDIIEDPKGLKLSFLEEIWSSSKESIESIGLVRDDPVDIVRHTFVLSRDHVEKLKKLVSTKCKTHGLGTLHVSTFVVTCSLIWVCKTISEDTIVGTSLTNNDESYILAFMADCRNRPEYLIPSTYFGNCLGCGNAVVKRSKLVGENGILEAAIAIGNEVRNLHCEPFKGVERLMSNFTEFATLGKHMVIIAGSQKLDVYDTDFGIGKPKISEVVHVDNAGSISLSDSRDRDGGIEVGLALERIQMNKFIAIFQENLTEIAVHD